MFRKKNGDKITQFNLATIILIFIAHLFYVPKWNTFWCKCLEAPFFSFLCNTKGFPKKETLKETIFWGFLLFF